LFVCAARAVADADDSSVTSCVWRVADEHTALSNHDAGIYVCLLTFTLVCYFNL